MSTSTGSRPSALSVGLVEYPMKKKCLNGRGHHCWSSGHSLKTTSQVRLESSGYSYCYAFIARMHVAHRIKSHLPATLASPREGAVLSHSDSSILLEQSFRCIWLDQCHTDHTRARCWMNLPSNTILLLFSVPVVSEPVGVVVRKRHFRSLV